MHGLEGAPFVVVCHGPQPPDANTTLQARGCMTITGGRQHEDWPGIMKAQKSAGRQSATHTLMVKSSLSTDRSVNARWCRAQHTAPTASELPSISCPTQWARCHHLRSQHFVRGSQQNEQGCDTHPQCPSEKRRKVISSIVFHMWFMKRVSLRAFDCALGTRILLITAARTSVSVHSTRPLEERDGPRYQ